jgi:acyl-coenzyme A thioesterase PaaI-like protein
MAEVSIQERLFPEATCFGCGRANPKGLRLESFVRDGGVSATFYGSAQHTDGFGFLSTGIVATLLDCHSGAAALNEADRQGWLPFAGLPYSFVTAGLDIRFLSPAPLHEPCDLRAHVLRADERSISVEAGLSCNGVRCASAESEWRRWRPRG